jgi:hypothetical protein
LFVCEIYYILKFKIQIRSIHMCATAKQVVDCIVVVHYQTRQRISVTFSDTGFGPWARVEKPSPRSNLKNSIR